MRFYEVRDILAYSEQVARTAAGSPRDWMAYLDTAARLYRYPFADSLLIHAQRPDATACASLELWNKKMNRWVNRGAKGIALIDDTGPRKRLRYVFDISDTHMVRGGRTPGLWRMEEWHKEKIAVHLAEVYEAARREGTGLEAVLYDIAEKLAEEKLDEAVSGLKGETEGTFLEGMSERELRESYRELLISSLHYVLARRCGLDPMLYLHEDDFAGIVDFNTQAVLAFLGDAAIQLAEPVLRDIGQTVRKISMEEMQKPVEKHPESSYNQFNALKRENADSERGIEDGADLPPQRGLPVSEPGHTGRGGADREIRDAEKDVSERTQEGAVPEHAAQREAGQPPHGNRADGGEAPGNPDERDAGEIPGPGQEDGPAGMGRAYEQPESNGGGEYLDGIGVQLNGSGAGAEMSEAEEETASALFLPVLPSPERQRREIEERAAAPFAGKSPVPPEIVDEVLRKGGGRRGSHLRIIYNFMIEQPADEYVEYVRREYGTGGIGMEIDGRKYSVWYDGDGMRIAAGNSVEENTMHKAFLSWEDVSARIHQLLLQGEYAPVAVLDAARGNALREHAQALAYMERDLADGVAGLVFDDVEIFRGGFPDVEERIMERIAQPEYLADLNERLEGLAEAYEMDKDLMRFHIYSPDRVSAQFQKFARDAVPFAARDGFAWKEHKLFITQDETDAVLRGGSGYSDSRLTVYAFFIKDKTKKHSGNMSRVF